MSAVAEITPPDMPAPILFTDSAAAKVADPKCTVCRVCLLLSPEDQAGLDAALADDKIPDKQVADGLCAEMQEQGHEGLEVKPTAVGRHRRGECARGTR